MKLSQYIAGIDPELTIFIGAGAGFLFIGSYPEYKQLINRIDCFIIARESRILTEVAVNTSKGCKLNHVYRKEPNAIIKDKIKYLHDYKSIAEREAKTAYIKKDGSVAIIVDGKETINVWTAEEFGSWAAENKIIRTVTNG